MNNTWKNLGYESYSEYLASPRWKELIENLKQSLNNKCEINNCKEISLEVHHITYNNLGNEGMRDVVLLCSKHHKEAHKTNNESIKKIRRYLLWE